MRWHFRGLCARALWLVAGLGGVGLRRRRGLCSLQLNEAARQRYHAHRLVVRMRPARHAGHPVVCTHYSPAVSATWESVIDQPGQKSFSRRFVAIENVLAETAVGPFVTGGAGPSLILNMSQSSERETMRDDKWPQGFGRPHEFDRVFNGAPALFRRERLLAGGRVLFSVKSGPQLFKI